MKVRDLVTRWERSAERIGTAETYAVHLPLQAAARIAALQEMFPGQSREELITDLLCAALDDLEESLPYIPGQRVIAEDDRGDPIFEDVGHTPRLQQLTQKHLQRLRGQSDSGT